MQGSDTNWYRNVLKNPTMKISVHGQELNGKAKTITNDNKVKEIIEKFRSKYGSLNIPRLPPVLYSNLP